MGGFTIIKKAVAKTLHKPVPEPRPKITTKPTSRRDPLLWGVVGHKVHKNGSVQCIFSSVPYSEASPCLRQQFDQDRKGRRS